jgi:CRISPR-associated protein Cmr2
MEEYIVTIAVGPVQDFIAASRRLRDLWFGSYLLSELSKQAVRSLHNRGAELIFPSLRNAAEDLLAGSDMTVPNKILARVSCEDPRQVFSEIKDEVTRFWLEELAEKTIEKSRTNVDQALFNSQIKDFPEIYGAWSPLNGNGYVDARRRADSLLAARKSLRDFSQPEPILTSQGGGLPKSSLDGVRESVLRGDQRKKGIKENEELDALGWIKRYGEKLGASETTPEFDSLSDLAADPFLRGAVKNPEAYKRLEKLKSIVVAEQTPMPKVSTRKAHRKPLGDLPPQVLFRSRLGRDFDRDISNEAMDSIHGHLKRLFHAAGQSQGPLPYTAILVGDGDFMGRTIDHLTNPGDHQAFSDALTQFSRSAADIVRTDHGCMIYAGGDDVMAFVALDRVVDCADRLRTSFEDNMKAALPDEKDRPTFSIGIAIVHHLRPMGLSLQLARKAERLAKDQGRASLAIILDKRSGAPIQVWGRWQDELVRRLMDWRRCHLRDLIPDKLGYDLRHLASEFGDGKMVWKGGQPDNPLAYEFLRVLQRKRADQGRRKVASEDIDRITKIACQIDELDRLSNELILSRILADAQRQAGEEV